MIISKFLANYLILRKQLLGKILSAVITKFSGLHTVTGSRGVELSSKTRTLLIVIYLIVEKSMYALKMHIYSSK
jgi:alkylhydroperoxidase/carboxymuconolactone decarboxylase family protein YurZ